MKIKQKIKHQSEKIKELLYREEVEGEKRMNKFILMFYPVFLLTIGVNAILMPMEINTLSNFVGLCFGLIYHIILFFIMKNGIYRIFYKYISVFINTTVITIILIGYSIGTGWVHSLRTSVLLCYAIIIVSSGFYQNPSICYYASIVVALHYMGMFLTAFLTGNLPMGNSETFEEPVYTIGLLTTIVPILLMIGALTASITKRLRIVIDRSLKSEAEAYENEMAKEVLERTHEQKTTFFMNFAHETKTPLTIIKNYLLKDIKNRGVSKDLNIVSQNLAKLERDIINFLDVESIERGSHKYSHDQVIELSDFFLKKIESFKELANNNSINISNQYDKKVFIKIDPAALDRILNNIMDNAIKYTETNGWINTEVKEIGDFILLSVRDTGVGIPKDQLENIFKPYFQISHKKMNVQGFGLGLYITKKIIDDIRGRIEVKSSVNIGTTVNILFKREQFHSNDDFISRKVFPNDVILHETDNIEVKKRENTKIFKDSFNPEKETVMIVEDNYDLSVLMQSDLIGDFNVFVADNGQAAIDQLSAIPRPDLIVSDVMMDVMDGYELYYSLSQNEKYNYIPFIFITARTNDDEKIKYLNQGAIDYIYKPFDMNELRAKIAAVIRNKKIKDLIFEKNKFASLGKLVGGISHELLNPLSMIYEPVELLEMELKNLGIYNKSFIKKYLDNIINNAERIENIIKNMKIFAHKREFNKANIDIKPLIESIRSLFHNKIKNRIEIFYDNPENIQIWINAEALSHILINLVSNSIDAITDRGEISITVNEGERNTNIVVKDNGFGIKPGTEEKIFEAFYTDKEAGKGSGLGLFIVKDLMLKMLGKLDIKSAPETGTEITLIFPKK